MALGQAFSVVAIMEAQVVNPFGNALVPDMIADASIQEIDGMFYCYATTDGYGRGLETSGPPVVWKSEDFGIGVSTGHISRRQQLRNTGLPVK